MATYRTRDPMDAARFVRALQDRGYTKRKRPAKGGALPANTYQVSRDVPQYVVSFYEPEAQRRIKSIPEALPAHTAKGLKVCTVPGCPRPHHTRGLCNSHHQRWLRATNPESKERMRRRAAANRAKRKAKREEAA